MIDFLSPSTCQAKQPALQAAQAKQPALQADSPYESRVKPQGSQE